MKNKSSHKDVPMEWSLVPAGAVFRFIRTYAFSRDNLLNETDNSHGIGNIHYGDIHSTYSGSSIDLGKISVPMIKDADFMPRSEDLLKDGDLVMADASEDYEGIGVAVSIHGVGNKKVVGGLHTYVLRDNKQMTNEYYRQYIFRNPKIRNQLQKVANGVSVYGISKTAVSKILLPLPSLPEQGRIVAVLETWDRAINQLGGKIEIKKEIKKGLMQELLTCKRRLPKFKDKWQTVEIGDLLDYEQPTKYIVASTEYHDHNEVPVLTANKGFILGYTDETNGVYKNTPAIIFDDFTMDHKFVDFEFKVKSSAIKILTPKNENVNLKFVFGKIQLINVVIGEHRRHYLSEYQYLTIDIPGIKEQNAIEEILTTADKEIQMLECKLKTLQEQKKFLLNSLVTGKTLTPESLMTSQE